MVINPRREWVDNNASYAAKKSTIQYSFLRTGAAYFNFTP